MIIIHHNDLDGRMAAAFTAKHMQAYAISEATKEIFTEDIIVIPKNVKNDNGETFSPVIPLEDLFYEYYYNNKFTDVLNHKRIVNHNLKEETVFIVDCSITEKSAEDIMVLLDTVKQVVLIDHHQSSVDYMIHCQTNEDVYENSIFNRNNFYHCITNIYSGALLCDAMLKPLRVKEDKKYVFNCVKHLFNDVYEYEYFQYYDEGDYNNISNFDKTTVIAYKAALLTDDYDRWIHKFEDSKYLNSGVRLEDPYINTTYTKLIEDVNYLNEVIAKGKTIVDYINSEANINKSRCHEEEICGIKTLCLNAKGNSSCFTEENFEKYNMVCLYYFNGLSRVWTYSFFSKHKENGICHKIAAKFGGGGHPGAAGCSTPIWLFSEEGKKLIQEAIEVE